MLLWVSFADPHKPKGQTFLGVVIVPAGDDAIGHAKAILGDAYHPCVDIMAYALADNEFAKVDLNRVISKEEIIERKLADKVTREG